MSDTVDAGPRLLDLYCGAGGAAMGYSRAGFDVVGVDIRPQPNYPFEFVQADALEYMAERFAYWPDGDLDAIHASPPCQAYSTIGKQARKLGKAPREHPDLVAETRELLQATGLPYVIENVVGAPLIEPVQLCGSALGLDVRRHRLFEANWPLMVPPCQHGWQTPRFFSQDKRRGGKPMSVVGVYGHLDQRGDKELRQRAMEIDWMSPYELTQAVPPAMTELIGHQLLAYVRAQPNTTVAEDYNVLDDDAAFEEANQEWAQRNPEEAGS